MARHSGPGALDAVFWFGLVTRGWDPRSLPHWLTAPLDVVTGVVWVLGNHDRSRPVSRYGAGATGHRRTLLLAALLVGLPGFPLVYQGDELGLTDARLAAEDVQDPLVRQAGGTFSRDVVRTPMPWQPGAGLGFSTAPRPWLPYGDHQPADTVAVQLGRPGSPLHSYRALLRMRRDTDNLCHGANDMRSSPPCSLRVPVRTARPDHSADNTRLSSRRCDGRRR